MIPMRFRVLGCRILLSIVGASLVSCTLKVPAIKDRHTILEEEAAGEWPDFDKDSVAKSEEMGPTPYPKVGDNAKKKRLYNVLNGELGTDSKDPKSAGN